MKPEEYVYECDLHCHTTRSDGNATVREVIDLAAKRGLKVLAITDHDIRPPKTVDVDGVEWKLEDYAASKGLQVIPGIEISCDTAVEDVHIVCFRCNWDDPFFDQLEADTVRSKIKSYSKLVELLDENGIHITWEELLYNDGNPIKEEELQKKKIFELMAKRGYAKSWKEAKLFVKHSKLFNVMREKPDPVEIIHKVHETGGICILAHPYLINAPVMRDGKVHDRCSYIGLLIDAGLDGIEACYTYDKTSYDGERSKEELERTVREKYGPRVKFISGGSDYHADERKGVVNGRMIGECGVTYADFTEHILPYLK